VYRSKSGPLVSALGQSRRIDAPDASARRAGSAGRIARRAACQPGWPLWVLVECKPART